jgi:tetratricopeptide (TPR) repeat protein
VATAQRLADIDPGVPAWVRAARLRFLHKDLEGAIELMARAARSAGPRGETAAWVWLELSRLHLHGGTTTHAAQAVAAAQRAHPSLSALLPARARLLHAQGEPSAALDLYRQGLAVDPAAEDALAAWRLARQLGREGVAKHLAALLDGLARLDAEGLSRRALAEYFSESGRNGRALELARRELSARPDIYSHATLARVLARQGHGAEAENHARQALVLDTPDPQLQADMRAILATRTVAAARETQP